jgi:hypothetical protein
MVQFYLLGLLDAPEDAIHPVAFSISDFLFFAQRQPEGPQKGKQEATAGFIPKRRLTSFPNSTTPLFRRRFHRSILFSISLFQATATKKRSHFHCFVIREVCGGWGYGANRELGVPRPGAREGTDGNARKKKARDLPCDRGPRSTVSQDRLAAR